MINDEFIRKLSERAAGLAPAAEGLRQDMEARVYELLKSSLGKLNVVTREEFDQQLAVLERTRLALAELELKVAELEGKARRADTDQS